MMHATTIDPIEVEKFSKMAAEWWNPDGKFGVLHKFNPVRLDYIKQMATAHFARDLQAQMPLDGLDVLDIGCGGGLLSEPIARLGAKVTGADPAEKNVKTASVHAQEQGLEINYRATSAEALAADGAKFDVIVNMEVIEHVADPAAFMAACATMLKPDGLMFVATLNRTLKSFGLAILGAEYLLGWLPKGTHQWEKFITPEEMDELFKTADLRRDDLQGVIYNPFTGHWKSAKDTAVNYMMTAVKAG